MIAIDCGVFIALLNLGFRLQHLAGAENDAVVV
jgi:hypothetical protein